LLRAWSLVYVGNIVGALGTAALVFLAGHYGFVGGALGKTALAVSAAKAALPTVQLFFLAVLCNVLVCLAVWMSFGSRTTTDKVIVIVPPIAAFVTAGFEHSIANLYLLPYALVIKAWAGAEFWTALGLDTGAPYPELTVGSALHNIVVATWGTSLAAASWWVRCTGWSISVAAPELIGFAGPCHSRCSTVHRLPGVPCRKHPGPLLQSVTISIRTLLKQ
jgi:formate transporter